MATHTAGETTPGRHRVCTRILDPKFRLHKRRYLAQCLLATLAVFTVLSLLDALHQTVLVAALGASAFIAFTMPHIEASRPRYLVGGYLVAIVVGCSASGAAGIAANSVPVAAIGLVPVACAALATGVAMLIMVCTDTEHPPAAALALGFVLNDWDPLTALTVFSGVVAIALIKESIKGAMIDLL